MIIIGITGTLGSGKGTVVDYLVSKYGFKHYSARKFIQEEMLKRGFPDNRDSMRIVGNAMRAEFGSSYVAEQLYERAQASGDNSVIESLRSTGEIIALRQKPEQFFMLAVDADPKTRYERILLRKSSTDNINFEKFLENEQQELADTGPGGMNITECIKISDALITNDGSIEDLQAQVDNVIRTLVG